MTERGTRALRELDVSLTKESAFQTYRVLFTTLAAAPGALEANRSRDRQEINRRSRRSFKNVDCVTC